ncbi:MAG: hypothetical protein ACFE9V_18790 [Candidatus Hodarchaeota archaeon]
MINEFDTEIKAQELEYKKLMLTEIKLAIKQRRTSLMLSRLELWRILRLRKEMDEYERDFGEEDKEERDRSIV